jgi:hypothetical protein
VKSWPARGRRATRCSGARRRRACSAPASLRRCPGAVPPRLRLPGNRRRSGLLGAARAAAHPFFFPLSPPSPFSAVEQGNGEIPQSKWWETSRGARVAALGDWIRG